MKGQRVVLLENIRSLHNVGAVFRSADGAGFQHVICAGYTPRPDDARMNKVSLGAEQSISWSHESSAIKAALSLKNKDIFFLHSKLHQMRPIFFWNPHFQSQLHSFWA